MVPSSRLYWHTHEYTPHSHTHMHLQKRRNFILGKIHVSHQMKVEKLSNKSLAKVRQAEGLKMNGQAWTVEPT